MRKASIFLIIAVLTVSLVGCLQRNDEPGNDESSAPPSSFSAGETEESPTPSEEPTVTTESATTPPAESEQPTTAPTTSATASQGQAASQTKPPQSTPGNSTPATPTPEESQQPTPAKTPTPTPEPTAEPSKEKSIYDYEFDIAAIKKELIAIGEGMGLTHITTDDGVVRTPDNSSWAQPVTASQSFQGENLKRALGDYVTSMPGIVKSYGGSAIEYFTIYVKPSSNGSYTFYFLY